MLAERWRWFALRVTQAGAARRIEQMRNRSLGRMLGVSHDATFTRVFRSDGLVGIVDRADGDFCLSHFRHQGVALTCAAKTADSRTDRVRPLAMICVPIRPALFESEISTPDIVAEPLPSAIFQQANGHELTVAGRINCIARVPAPRLHLRFARIACKTGQRNG